MGSKISQPKLTSRQPRRDVIFNTYLSVSLFFLLVVGKPLRCKEFRTTCRLSSLLRISIICQMVNPATYNLSNYPKLELLLQRYEKKFK